ncbi:hypothetical protein [Arthrobacter caoxuetaonis]|uniref:Uncharacterized protein n=1 Tax=Arthrobacter caoxuetaonis TaxID=2886935 RepID=A0A9X1MFS4_9MICC|nr:hypothetical protein [Arthrobacter caoxuetaonis]MCC3299313.1 hypothetical protein [Arthrobacter caoxuetaonis]USQ59194.1 hypothetical protein NF551_16555 [Arthrobacter caoxuetaonis]
MTTFRNRQPEGTPAGGQFASTPKSESDVALAAGTGTGGLDIDYDCNTEEVRALARAGLQGRITPYNGTDEDIPAGAVIYTSHEGHELAISGLGGEEVEVRVVTDDEHRSFRMTHGGYPRAEEVVTGIEFAAWREDVTDAFSVGFTDGQNEVRETYFDRNIETGEFFAGMTLSDQEGNWFTVEHDYGTGETSATPESGPGAEMPKIDLDAVMSDLTGSDASGNAQTVAAAAFAKIRNRVEGYPFYNKLAAAQIPVE